MSELTHGRLFPIRKYFSHAMHKIELVKRLINFPMVKLSHKSSITVIACEI